MIRTAIAIALLASCPAYATCELGPITRLAADVGTVADGNHLDPGFSSIASDVDRAPCKRTQPYTDAEIQAHLKTLSPERMRSLLSELAPGLTTAAASRAIGPRAWPRMLFLLDRFRLNASHLIATEAQVTPLSAQQLDEIAMAASDLPQQLLPSPARPIRQAIAGTADSGEGTYANSTIQLYPDWNKLSPELRRYVIVHELGHVYSDQHGALCRGRGWTDLSRWKKQLIRGDFGAPSETAYSNAPREQVVSPYAARNPDEDFAESFAAFRYNPKKLREAHPGKYASMQNLFGRDYLGAATCE